MSDYTDMTEEFHYKDLLTWQNMDRLAENDAYLKAANVPTGAVMEWWTATPPTGFVFADGGAITRFGDGAALFALWGTKYGTGDGSTTFNVLDIRGRSPIGAGTGSGLTARTLDANIGAETSSSDLDTQATTGSSDPQTAVGTFAASGNNGLASSQAGANTLVQRKATSLAFAILDPKKVCHFIIKL